MSGSRQQVSELLLCLSVPEQDTECLSAQGDKIKSQKSIFFLTDEDAVVSEVLQSFQVHHSLVVALFTWSTIFLNLHFKTLLLKLCYSQVHRINISYYSDTLQSIPQPSLIIVCILISVNNVISNLFPIR